MLMSPPGGAARLPFDDGIAYSELGVTGRVARVGDFY
jgi:hypothetical protein